MKIALIKKPMMIVSSILILSLLCHSCCAVPTIPTTDTLRGPIDDETLSFIQVGKTTKEDVLLKLGNPSTCSEDEKSFKYCWVIVHGIWFLLGGGGIIGKTHWLSVQFDENGIVEKYECHRSSYTEIRGRTCLESCN
jgi:outer membrane protein assembly factor BamE (lipoprotein component of BamABCDE complex)